MSAYVFSIGPAGAIYRLTEPHSSTSEHVIDVIYAPVLLLENTAVADPINEWIDLWENFLKRFQKA